MSSRQDRSYIEANEKNDMAINLKNIYIYIENNHTSAFLGMIIV